MLMVCYICGVKINERIRGGNEIEGNIKERSGK